MAFCCFTSPVRCTAPISPHPRQRLSYGFFDNLPSCRAWGYLSLSFRCAFPCYLLMPSIFSYGCGTSVSFPQRHVCGREIRHFRKDRHRVASLKRGKTHSPTHESREHNSACRGWGQGNGGCLTGIKFRGCKMTWFWGGKQRGTRNISQAGDEWLLPRSCCCCCSLLSKLNCANLKSAILRASALHQ